MAQQLDPFAEFVEEEDDPFAEFLAPEPVVTKPVAPVNPEPTADNILQGARQALANTPQIENVPEPELVEPSASSSGWLDRLTSPLTDLPSRAARVVSEPLMSYGESGTGLLNKAALYGGAFAQSLGDVGTSLTSPADLAATALTGGAGMAARKGLSLAPKLANAARVASVPPVLHGARELLDSENTAGQRAAGALEAGLGALGVRGIQLPKPVDDIPVPKTDLDMAQEALLNAPDYQFNVKPDAPLPDLESYIITGNQNNPTRGLTQGAVKRVMGATEVTDNAGNVIRRPLTTQRPILRPNANLEIATEIGESALKRVPVKSRVSPNETVEMPPKPVPTGDPEVDTASLRDYLSLPRAIQSAYDLSFPFRQGLGLIHTKGWWKAWPDMVRSVGSEEAYQSVINSIKERPNFIPNQSGKSFAKEAGLAITDLGGLAKREEDLGSKIAEKIPGLRASNRAYTAFANKLRADNFDSLIAQAESAGLNPKQNLVLAKEIAAFVNNASGRGSLGALENSAVALNNTLFSPRLMASRLQMLNPANYAMGNPLVRKQYLKSALALGTTWNAMAELSKLGGAEVNNDPQSSDFRQIKIGNTRIDPSGGFRPYIVLGARLSEILEKNKDRYTGKYGARTPVQDIIDFFENKMAPNAAFATGPFRGDEKFPFYAGDEIAKMFTPIMVQDILELYNEDPSLVPLAGLAGIGMGTNTYQPSREEEPRMTEPIFPKQYDLRFPRR